MPMTDRDVDDLLAEARQEILPPDALRARVLADAAAVQAAQSVPAPRRRRRGPGRMAVLGGWPGVSGLTAAGLAGLAIGLAAPAQVTGWIEAASVLNIGEAGCVPSIADLALVDTGGTQ